MTRCRINLYILLMQIICVYALEESKYDAPPILVQPTNLRDPKSLVLFWGKEVLSHLNCTANNADKIQWRYTSELFGPYEDLPDDRMDDLGLSQDGKNLRLSFPITNRYIPPSLRPSLNGYYICIVSNRFGYTVETPPIRIIVPSVSYDGFDIIPARASVGTQAQPFRMRCVDESLVTTPQDLISLDLLGFSWFKRVGKKIRAIDVDDRVAINAKTGDLYFASLTVEDKTGDGEEYQCSLTWQGTINALVSRRVRLQIQVNNEQLPPVTIAYPTTASQKRVVCVDNTDCVLTCIYRGLRADGSAPPPIEWTKPEGAKDVITTVGSDTNSIMFKAIKEADGQWICGATGFPTETITVEVMMYPRILEEEMIDQFVTVGTDVIFVCNDLDSSEFQLRFYINGKLVEEDDHEFGEHLGNSKTLRIPNAQREHSSSVTCIVSNEAGISYKSAELNVYSKSNLTLNPADGISIKEGKNTTDIKKLNLTCNAVLDPKVIRASIHWKTNHSLLVDQKVTQKKHDLGIDVNTTLYRNYTINSTILFKLTYDTQDTLLGHHWWCVVEMEFGGRDSPINVMTDAVPFEVITVPRGPSAEVNPFDDWWLVGLIIACCFIALIIVLVVCCVRQQKGEQYNLAEKEKMAGHSIDDDAGHRMFPDYKRPATGGYMPMSTSDQDPMPGSRSSLDRSEKALDSDSEGLDEYGDIDARRFNEDGSFIGQYGKASSSMDV